MGEGTSEDTKMIRKKDKALSFGQMAGSMKEAGKTELSTVKESILVPGEKYNMVFGLRERSKIG